MPTLRTIILFSSIIPLAGCSQFGCLTKKESECNCPTDIRQMVPWCAGEDAIFQCPCGPDREFYGHKPTCWGAWPAPAAQWRDAYCGPPQQEGVYGGEVSIEVDELPYPAPISNLQTENAFDERPIEEELIDLHSYENEVIDSEAGAVEYLPERSILPFLPTNPFR